MCKLHIKEKISCIELSPETMSSSSSKSKREERKFVNGASPQQASWSSVPNTPILRGKKSQLCKEHLNGGRLEKAQYSSQTGLQCAPDNCHDAVDKYNLLQSVKNNIPTLSTNMRKGDCGRIAIFGGCVLYTGAAFYCGLSALKTGADSVHVFCDAAAAGVIRNYTTELVIHPVLDQEYGMEEVDIWLPRIDCVVVGPGLGKNQSMLGRISCVLQKIVSLNIPVIIDGDGLWHIVHQPSTLRGYSNAVITPNSVELGYLHKTFCGNGSSASSDTDTCSNLATALGNITVMAKGPHDIITNGRVTISCSSPGSPRRCDGQGHILSGIAAAFVHWTLSSSSHSESDCQSQENSSQIAGKQSEDGECLVRACWASCHLVRASALMSYRLQGRASSAQDIVNCIGPQFKKIFDGETMI